MDKHNSRPDTMIVVIRARLLKDENEAAYGAGRRLPNDTGRHSGPVCMNQSGTPRAPETPFSASRGSVMATDGDQIDQIEIR